MPGDLVMAGKARSPGRVRIDDAVDVSELDGVRISEARGTADCAELVAVLDQVWEAGGANSVIDIATVVAMSSSGNPVSLARRDGVLVGGALGFFGPPGAPLHSHIVGVRAGLAPAGTGFALKLHQRRYCLDRGVTQMTWTFDPLVARNAWFNLGKLGARPIAYLPDHYGAMHDGVNRGQPSDRMLLVWDLSAEPAAVGPAPAPVTGAHLALVNDSDEPRRWRPPPAGHDGPVLVGVPADIQRLRGRDPEAARGWRQRSREAFTALHDAGWVATAFLRSGHYVYERPTLPAQRPPR